MPPALKRACTHPGCTALTTTGRCEAHYREPWAKRADAPKRITGRPLQRMRERLFARHPLCEVCEAAGRVTVATERDHRVPLCDGGRDDETNEAALCHACHKAKTATESARGRKAWQG